MGQDDEVEKIMKKIRNGEIDVNSQEGMAQILAISEDMSEDMLAKLQKFLERINTKDVNRRSEEKDVIPFNPFAEPAMTGSPSRKLQPELETEPSPLEYDPAAEIRRGPRPG